MNDALVKQSGDYMVTVSDLCVYFPVRKGIFGKIAGYVRAVDGVTFSIRKGEVFALVGESGCGKTTTAQALAGLVPLSAGSIGLFFDSIINGPVDWKKTDPVTAKKIRRQMQIIFQDPFGSLDPRMTVKSILEEPLIIHKIGSSKTRLDRIRELLGIVGLSDEYLNRYPHEFSGGQRQRIGIARALATSPSFIIADEPVSALDVSIQAQIINLLQNLRETYNLTLLFISHDLAVVRHLSDRISVMYRGKIVEYGPQEEIFLRPQHPYTKLLLESVPTIGKRRKTCCPIAADEPELQPPKTGCSFYPRCPKRRNDCLSAAPALRETDNGKAAACFHPSS